jgi:hypothetical protein
MAYLMFLMMNLDLTLGVQNSHYDVEELSDHVKEEAPDGPYFLISLGLRWSPKVVVFWCHSYNRFFQFVPPQKRENNDKGDSTIGTLKDTMK